VRLALRERASPPHPGSVDPSDVAAQEPEPEPSIDRFGWWLVLICAVAFILRLVIVYQGRNSALTGDGFGYSLQANLNARGEWFASLSSNGARPDALHPPAWALVLTIWAWLGQHSWLAQQTLASAVGTLTVGAVGLAGRRIGGGRVGLIAAGIAAVYPGLWVYERAILSETLLLLGIAVMILLAYRFWAHPSALLAAVLGLVCGLLALTRSEQILVLAVVVAPLILAVRHIGWRRRLGWLVLATLCVVVVVTPWTIYNLGRFERPVLLSNNFGSAVAQGNCDATYYGPYTGAYSAPCVSLAAGKDQSVENAAELHKGLNYLDHHVGRLPVVLFAREGRAFGFWNPLQQVQLDAEWESGITGVFGTSYLPTAIWVNRLALFGFWLLVIPGAAGVVVLRRRRIPVYPLLGFFAIVAVTVATTYGETRYRAAVEVPLVLLAAVGISAGLASTRRARSPRDRAVARPEPSLAPTTNGRDRLADQDRRRRLAKKVPVRALSVIALVLSLVGVAQVMNVADEGGPVKNAMVLPLDGKSSAGTILLEALAPRGVTKVEFRATGGGLRNNLVAVAKKSGKYADIWLGSWNASAVHPGRYLIWSVAYTGAVANSSPPINTTITS
jgi:4-amino-4-deoxy-L-arabinose transferase-like glycosyltransferase